MFSKKVPEFTVDLSLPESERWSEVMTKMGAPAAKVLAEAGHEFRHVPLLVRQLFARLYNRKGGLYFDEIRAIAKALRVSVGTATILNCAYELSHLYVPKIFGCTAGVCFVEGKGMVHVRTLDWPLPAMGDATCIFRFKNGRREFLSVGVPGQVGVLSGMVKGGYSVTINWAPPGGWPNFEFGPTFLLRTVLEACDSYAAAVKILAETPLSTSVFFTVCGLERGEACVIERTKNSAVVRPLVDGVVVQANHHEAPQFAMNNGKIELFEDASFLQESGVRAEVLSKALHQHKAGEDISLALDLKPVLNNETVQKMVFCPRTGEVEVWRLVSDHPKEGN